MRHTHIPEWMWHRSCMVLLTIEWGLCGCWQWVASTLHIHHWTSNVKVWQMYGISVFRQGWYKEEGQRQVPYIVIGVFSKHHHYTLQPSQTESQTEDATRSTESQHHSPPCPAAGAWRVPRGYTGVSLRGEAPHARLVNAEGLVVVDREMQALLAGTIHSSRSWSVSHRVTTSAISGWNWTCLQGYSC